MDRVRRKVIGTLAALLAAAPAGAQPTPQPPRKRVAICRLPSNAPDEDRAAKKFWAGLFAPHGFVDGENLELAIVRAKSIDSVANAKEWEAVARQVVASRPDVILVHVSWLHIFRALSGDIPIVFIGMLDAEHHGTIESLRRPGGNVTGVAEPFFELQEKRFELLKELRPGARRLALVSQGDGPYRQRVMDKLKSSTRRLGLDSVSISLSHGTDSVVTALRDARVELADFLWSCNHTGPPLGDQLIKLGVASSFACGSPAVHAGGLLSYVPIGMADIAVSLAARILRGEKVATMPAEQPLEFHLAVNLRTARALGITVPQSILVRAHELIE